MRVIAFLRSYPPELLTGAFISTAEYLEALAARKHDVHVICTAKSSGTARKYEGVWVHTMRDYRRLIARKTDLIVHHHGDVHRSIPTAVAAKKNIPRLLMVHGPTPSRPRLDNPELAWFDTDITRRYYRYKGPHLVLPPPVEPSDYATTPGTKVTLVGLSVAKGVDTFYKLAQRMPNIEFLGVAKTNHQQLRRNLPNVTVTDTTPDMRTVYAQTRVLLMPSVREAYGRTGIEAMCSGIPVIATPTRGMRHAYSRAAYFCQRGDMRGWERTLRQMMTDDTIWQQASERALQHVEALDFQHNVDTFCDAVERLAAGKGDSRIRVRARIQGAPGFAVVGTGRSGTGYVSKLLAANGLRVGHEKWWTVTGTPKQHHLHGDVSWMAVPSIEKGRWSGPVVHVTRDPVEVIRSLHGIGFFDGTDKRQRYGSFTEFAYRYEPKLRRMDSLQAAVEWWVRWNRRCAKVADLTVRLEDIENPQVLQQISGIICFPLKRETLRRIPVTVNTRAKERSTVSETEIRRLLNGRAAEFGY